MKLFQCLMIVFGINVPKNLWVHFDRFLLYLLFLRLKQFCFYCWKLSFNLLQVVFVVVQKKLSM